MSAIRRVLLAALVLVLVVAVAGATLWATALGGLARPYVDQVTDSVSVAAITDDLRTLQRITDENGGTRAGGTPGELRAAEFVAAELRSAGYEVQVDVFDLPYFHETGRGIVTAGSEHFRSGHDFRAMIFSAPGEVKAPLVPVRFDPDAAPGDRPGIGCNRRDLDGVPRDVILLVQGGGCPARQIVDNAVDAGAAAIIISIPGWRTDAVLRPTLRSPDVPIPVLGATHRMGVALAQAAAEHPRRDVVIWSPTEIVNRPTANVIGETPGGDANHVVMLGGHLDSVIDGPGINDNGSGTMTILEIARRLAEAGPARKVRVAFWSGEEIGLYGSFRYINGLHSAFRSQIEVYLNFDMLGSANGGRIIYNDDAAVDGSATVKQMFEDWFDSQHLSWIAEDLGGGSDHYGFEINDVPTGGLFSGANEVPGEEEAAHFGVEAGTAYDACYHLTCDRFDNINVELLGQMARAAAHVAAQFASGEATAR